MANGAILPCSFLNHKKVKSRPREKKGRLALLPYYYMIKNTDNII